MRRTRVSFLAGRAALQALHTADKQAIWVARIRIKRQGQVRRLGVPIKKSLQMVQRLKK